MERKLVETLLTEIAPLLDAEHLTALNGGGWVLGLNPETQLDIEYDETVPRLVVSCDIAPMPPRDRNKALEFLLAYNYVWPLHGGIRTALDKPRDHAVLLLDVPTSALTPQFFVSVLGNVQDTLLALRRVLAIMDTDNGGDGAAVPDPILGAIRA